MNEVTRIHLGRQPYSISVSAYKSLKDYLADIEAKVVDKEVVNEVELRMSELLTEHGVTGDKVIIPEDVKFLKEQLGDPEDFGDSDETPEAHKSEDKPSRRFFRDTDNAMIAGVAAGLSGFLGLDVILVRLIFVLLTIFGGGMGIVIYLVLWLVVPAAETASEKLQMQGKQVTLEALKDSVSNADVHSAARRVNSRVLSVIDGIFRLGVKVVGGCLVLFGLSLLAFISVTKIYMLLHGDKLVQEDIFPVGVREEWLLLLIMILGVIVAIFLMLSGITAFKRKWPVRGWITAVLAGMFLLGSVASVALAADAVPRVRDRYEATLHTTAVKNIEPFNKVVSTGDVDIAYVSSPNYAVNIHYSDDPDISKIKIHVANKTLYIDSTTLDTYNHCTMLCLFPRYNMTVQVYAPNIEQFVTPPKTDIFYPAPPALN